jgi:hypothetical protein
MNSGHRVGAYNYGSLKSLLFVGVAFFWLGGVAEAVEPTSASCRSLQGMGVPESKIGMATRGARVLTANGTELSHSDIYAYS